MDGAGSHLARATFLASSGLASPYALLLQADADTVYLPGYVRQMKHEAGRYGRGYMFEAAAVTAAEFRRKYLAFDELCRTIDIEMSAWFVRDEDDVVVDDKVSGLFLADYYDWGGHFVQRMRIGEELLAESTRLFIFAKQAHGAKKVKVAALALPSRRKLATQAVAYFASAGFPRGPNWNARWTDEPCGSAVDFLQDPRGSPCIAAAASSRRRHLLALFGLLPLLVDDSTDCRAELRELRLGLPPQQTATALERVLTLADDEYGSLQRIVAQQPGSQPI